MQRTAKFFGLFYNMNLNSAMATDDCRQMKMYLRGVEHNPLPSRHNPTRTRVTTTREETREIDGQEYTVPVEEEVEVSPDARRDQHWKKLD